ncbi:MAG TPA: hypothetical protein VEA99_03255 [Gemmatimonadaceae bacterium]|nr:hypothetical protein [Gemmatimonadaceae bacterium]
MTLRLSTTSAFALLAALTISSEAFAQVRSDTRIPVRKGETPAPARTDTVVVRDTIRLTTTDTVTVTRRDTVIQRVEVAPPPTPFGRFYFGLQGGAALPIQAMNIPHSPGFTAGALLGWDSFRAPLGLRLDGGYTRIGEEEGWAGGLPGCGTDDECAGIGDPELWHANIDAKLRIPFTAESPARFYIVGGATYNRFRGFTFVDDDANNAIVLRTDDWHDKWGGNVGAGLQFGFGRANLFLEGRLQTMNIGNTTQNHVPIVLGLLF